MPSPKMIFYRRKNNGQKASQIAGVSLKLKIYTAPDEILPLARFPVNVSSHTNSKLLTLSDVCTTAE
jgi:hypothetical protein